MLIFRPGRRAAERRGRPGRNFDRREDHMAKTILVIDDSDTVREQVRQTLLGAGYEVIEASDGLDGLEKIRSSNNLSLVLCDINMPRMNGLEMLSELHHEGATIPIIMLTTEGQPTAIRRARENGAKGWIVKPFKAELLVAAIVKILAPKPVAVV
jgi:two-component system chemotaxis response regulator CheY